MEAALRFAYQAVTGNPSGFMGFQTGPWAERSQGIYRDPERHGNSALPSCMEPNGSPRSAIR